MPEEDPLPPSIQLGELQLAILQELILRGEASASELFERLTPTLGLARTTIATVLSKLEKKGLVEHRTEGRQYVYRAVVGEDELQRSLVGDLVERVFRGDAAELVNHLLRERELDDEALGRLKEIIEAAERRAEGRE